MSTNSVAKLLQELLAKGIEAKDALPVVKALIEGRIRSLDDIDENTKLPPDIPSKIRRKILPKKGGKVSPPPKKKQKLVEPIVVPKAAAASESQQRILINRAPVLTLWAAVVAEKTFSVSFTEALSLGSAVASVTARGKGMSIGIFRKEDDSESRAVVVECDREYDLLGTEIRARSTPSGIRAVGENGEESDPYRTWRLLNRRFGNYLGLVCREFRSAAQAAGDSLPETAYQFYQHIRPDIPEGTKGWGAHGHLDMKKVSSFYKEKVSSA